VQSAEAAAELELRLIGWSDVKPLFRRLFSVDRVDLLLLFRRVEPQG
jgi:hypothetical protein